MTKEEIVKALVEQVVAMGFKIRMITLEAGFYTVDELNFISQFNYIVAVPIGDVKVFEEFDGDYKTNSKRHRRDEQVKFRLLVYSKEKVRRKKKKSLVYFARATNLDLPKGEVLDLYNKVRGPIETSYRNIKAFLPFTSSTKFVFRILIFVLALVLYSLFKGEVGREEFRLLLILLFFPDLFNPENFTINLVETLIYTIDLFLRR